MCEADITMACCGFDSIGSKIMVEGVLTSAPSLAWPKPPDGARAQMLGSTLDNPRLCRIPDSPTQSNAGME